MKAWDVAVHRSRKALKAQGHHRMCWFWVQCMRMVSQQLHIKTDRKIKAGGARKSSRKMAQDTAILKSSHQSNCTSSIIDVSSLTPMACMKVIRRIDA